MNLDNLVKDFEQEGAVDYVGLQELVVVVTDGIEEKDPQKIRAATLELVRRMLASGFRAGEFAEANEGLVLWPDQNPDVVVRRIETEWSKLGTEPNIGDICWFELKHWSTYKSERLRRYQEAALKKE